MQHSVIAKTIVWGYSAVITLATIMLLISQVSNLLPHNLPALVVLAPFTLLPLAFTALGALVITHQPNNTIGWLMTATGLSNLFDAGSFSIVHNIAAPPDNPAWYLLLAVWANRTAWVYAVFPVMLILLLFPTGRPPGRRWNGLVIALIILEILFLFTTALGQTLTPYNEQWSIPNPAGIIPDAWVTAMYSVILQVMLGILVLFCAVALFIRYRRSSPVEQAQIKWLAYASSIFSFFYLIAILTLSVTGLGWESNAPLALAVQFPASLSASTIPIVITIAILRYRIYDIDIIIRRTLVYSILTGLLALIYFGGVVLLQGILEPLTGSENSPLVTVITTLAIAALFTPLRSRVQQFIDQRFYRQKYSTEQTLNRFSATARSEVALEQLESTLVAVVNETMQPTAVSLWMHQ